jgi:antirestriction protein ArdC
MEQYYATLFHEITHATGHTSRLNRLDNAARFGSDSYSKEELVADLGGYFICAHAGITNESIHNNSVAYLASWLKVLKAEPKILISAASQAQKAVDLILNRKP